MRSVTNRRDGLDDQISTGSTNKNQIINTQFVSISHFCKSWRFQIVFFVKFFQPFFRVKRWFTTAESQSCKHEVAAILPLCLINPEVKRWSYETRPQREGCLRVPRSPDCDFEKPNISCWSNDSGLLTAIALPLLRQLRLKIRHITHDNSLSFPFPLIRQSINGRLRMTHLDLLHRSSCPQLAQSVS
jgi:hypothetical protein